ncbi:MAG: translocation/assembly module TamB domain-containing protein [Methylotenera sp.]|nr:translocation/assembly module TamB domain-containing protein [Methylotenera sp.]
MLRRILSLGLLCLALVLFTPAHSEMNISASSSLDKFSYDIEHIHLKLEKISTRWQLSPTAPEKLEISQLKAKRLTITIQEKQNKSESLPEQLNLPLDLNIKQAEIEEIVIIQAGKQQILRHVLFSFTGDKKNLNLNLIQADTDWGQAQASLNLQTQQPYAVNGWGNLKQTSQPLPFDIKTTISGDLNLIYFNSTSLLALEQDKLSIVQHTNSTLNSIAQIKTTGTIALSHDYAITINTRISELQTNTLATFSKLFPPQGNINLDLTLQGNLQPSPAFDVTFNTHNSLWQNTPLAMSGELNLANNSFNNIAIKASIGNNHLQADGTLGQRESNLAWQLALNDMQLINPEISGKLSANGSIIGELEHLGLNFKLLGDNIKFNHALSLASIRGEAEVSPSTNGNIAASLTIDALRIEALQLAAHTAINTQVTITGRRNAHLITLSAHNAQRQIRSTLQGGLIDFTAWQGVLQSFSHQSSVGLNNPDIANNIQLIAPAQLDLSSQKILLQNTALQLAQGQVLIEHLQLDQTGFISRGHFEATPIFDALTSAYPRPEIITGEALFSGDWDINHQHERLNGKLEIQHHSSNLLLTHPSGEVQPITLNTAQAIITASNNQIGLKAELDAKSLGQARMTLSTEISKTANGYSLLSNAPLLMDATLKLDTLAWLPLPATLKHANLQGKINLAMQANGTLDAPNLTGYAKAENMAITLISEGLALSNGKLDAVFEKNKMLIQQASLDGGDGKLNVSGSMLFESRTPNIHLEWNAQDFTVISRTDRLLVLNGRGQSTLANDLLTILGNIEVKKGLIELEDSNTPTLSDDVEIIGANSYHKEAPLRILLNGLRINLGKDFTLRGQGLNAMLTGAVTLTGLTQYSPHTEGTIQITRGTYMAYGQVLNIDRGIFNFSGPMGNPSINIRAMRNSKPINAGVEITGNAIMPITKLVSDPDVPESEKLSWLVLGHGMDNAGKNDYAMLSLAAGALLSQGQSIPLQTQLARAAGLDEFSFSGGDAESAALVFGKRLSSKLYLSYEKSVSGLLDVARLTFNITPRWLLRAEAGTESAVDVLYTFSFK